MVSIRCKFCHKLLFYGSGLATISIKCVKCKTINSVELNIKLTDKLQAQEATD